MSELHHNLGEQTLPIPSWDEYFMRHVYLAASKSKDPRTQIGAILVRDGILISEGYNGFARGVEDQPGRYMDRELKYKFVVHGEANAVLNCARHGIATKGSVMFTSGCPCCDCAKAIIQAGVQEIVIHAQNVSAGVQWEESAKISRTMFLEAGIRLRKFDKILGLRTLKDGKIVTV